MQTKNDNLKSLDQFIDEKFGKLSTSQREDFEANYKVFKTKAPAEQCLEKDADKFPLVLAF